MKVLVASLLAAASLAAVSAQTKSKVNPPNHSQPGPQYYIYQDIDYISYPNSSTTACPSVKAIRYKCYSEGIKKNSYFAEQQCLCTPDTAYQVTQCFAQNYGEMSAGPEKDNYYEDFLDYVYDCYCGVTGYDVSYNTTNNPPTPWVKGYTGDCIVPPTGGCPAKNNDNSGNRFPTPPCGCTPPPKPPKPACPSGYQRVNDCCVPNPPPTPTCGDGFFLDSDGTCVCPYPGQVINNQCQAPSCPDPNQILVQTPRAAYCECGPGYDEILPNVCDKVCPAGQTRQGPHSVCEPVCSDPNEFWNPNTQECICADWLGYHINHDGQCTLQACAENEVYSDFGACYCPDGFYQDSDGNCRPAVCTDLVSSCSPDSPAYASTATQIVSYTTDAPSYTPYSATTTYNTSYNSLVPYSSYTQVAPTVTLGNATTTQSTVSYTAAPLNSTSTTPVVISTTSTTSNSDATSTMSSSDTSTDNSSTGSSSSTTDDSATSTDDTSATSTDNATSDNSAPTDTSGSDGASSTDQGGPASPTARPRAVRRAKAWKREMA